MKKNFIIMMVLMIAITISACSNDTETEVEAPVEAESAEVEAALETAQEMPIPPVAEKRPHTVTAPAGDREDPYYWMRDDEREDPDVISWLEAENDYLDVRLTHTEA
ncbi:MAG: oligopeptidase B, partial [Pseudomonadota bacterium]